MARLREYLSDAAMSQELQHTDSSIHESATTAFAGTNEFPQPAAQSGFADAFKLPHLPKVKEPKALVCKKVSPRKDARRLVQLKPMGFATQDEDLSLMTVRRDWDDEVRRRPKRTLFSPSKNVMPDVSSNSSLQSMVSDSDEATELSLPASLTSDASTFELDARIPSNLISDTRRQLFSPTKPRNVSILDFDTMVDALASTRIEDISEAEDETESQPAIRSFPSLLVPTLPPPSTKSAPQSRPSTPPPASPTKAKLVSPSKSRFRVPTPPPTTSPSGFWSVDKVNEWNEQHSPQKIVRSPKKSRMLLNDSSPSSTPRRLQSPSKLTREMIAVKRDFESRKKSIAASFLIELDEKITDGKIGKLAEETGGVEIIWSKTLNSTAGRANWRRETKTKRASNDEKVAISKHFASIELAEKVIDDEERLLNVLAHEFCHLANFMISNIKDRPHGAEFKAWGQKCTVAFADRGINVTTKHTYAIDYKYIWACTNDDCQVEFKRHSRSIDPARHTCGVCRASLVQIKPAPRKAAGAKVTGYAAFVKEHYAALRKDMPGANQKEIMGRVGEKYREMKKGAIDQENQEPVSTEDLDDMAGELGRVTLNG